MRRTMLVILCLVLTLAPVTVQVAQARLDVVYAAETVFNGLSTNNAASALSAFAPDAIAVSQPRDEHYAGREEIQQLLYRLTRIGRTYDIVGLTMTGNQLELTVAMSEYGRRWGTMTVTAEEQGGKLTVFRITGVRLTL